MPVGMPMAISTTASPTAASLKSFRKVKTLGRKVSTAEPRYGPSQCPSPPSTIMIRTLMRRPMSNVVGSKYRSNGP
jgi:hypothetical protein